jgi:hypothetical protein
VKAYDLAHPARRVALLVLAAIGVHQLRYLFAYGSDSAAALSEQGHGYLENLLPHLIGAAVVLMAATVATRLISSRSRTVRSRLSEWPLYAVALLAIFSAQELVEGSLASEHPAGLAALVANGGWIAAPLAALFGVLVALGLQLLERADSALGKLTPAPVRRRRPPTVPDPRTRLSVPLAQLALAFGFARRPPPLSLRSI